VTGALGVRAIRGLKPIVGEPTIRGLKPTAKFIRRYATGGHWGVRDPWVETRTPALKRRAKFNRR